MKHRTPVEISKHFTQTDGLGVLDIEGKNRLGGALILHQKAVSTVFNQFDGSIGQWFVNSPDNRFREIGQHFYEMSDLFIDSSNLDLVAPKILKPFVNGEYEVYIKEFELDSEFVATIVEIQHGTHIYEVYPWYDTVVKILPEQVIDSGRVEKWRTRIRQGERPAIILAQSPNTYEFWCYFLIDGHHRINAYFLESIKPRAVIVVKQNPSDITSISLRHTQMIHQYEASQEIAKRFNYV